LKFGFVVAIIQNLVANDYKSHVVVNGLVTFLLISTSVGVHHVGVDHVGVDVHLIGQQTTK
jgi:hypothetical protein